jgi:RNA-directed DNA polymerase
MTKQYEVTQAEVRTAWEKVRRAGGGAGHDGKSIQDIKEDEESQLYKLWNRLSSGSYMAQPVQLVQIPKVSGGMRTLGIPTVTDRIAQMVIKNRLEPLLDQHFHDDSYAYRSNRSAEQAVGAARNRCFTYKWVLDIDISKFFDTLDHVRLMSMLKEYTEEAMIHLYVERFLKAEGINEKKKKERVVREIGTPQGGVVSPLLANLYLHEAFDKWMTKFPEIPFERYADDIIVHCVSENQAYFMRNRIEGRLKMYGLTMNPEKTQVVYTGTDDSQKGLGKKVARKFTFLGYEFKPRRWIKRMVFTPAIGGKAKKTLRDKMKKWNLKSKLSESVEKIAQEVNSQIRGWINYYGHYRRSSLYGVAYDIDMNLVRWIKQKFKLRVGYNTAWDMLDKIKREKPRLFCHWYMISPKPARAV